MLARTLLVSHLLAPHRVCLIGVALLIAFPVHARAEPGLSAQGKGSRLSTESGARGHTHGACERLKRVAVIRYYACLLTVGDSARQQARCAARFERRFFRADELEPGCPPLDDFDRTERAVRDQARAVLIGTVSAPPCQAITQAANGLVTCQLHAAGLNLGTSVAALDDVLAQIHGEPDCEACSSVTVDTPLWLQAWGGTGGRRSSSVTEADPGFAQMVTTIDDLSAAKITTLYFYLGAKGGGGGAAGSAGGASTLVTATDLQSHPTAAPTDALLIAGGSGGSGGQDTACILGHPSPGHGGAGGLAISVTGPEGQRAGQGKSGAGTYAGSGGGDGVGGGSHGSGDPGSNGIGGHSGHGGNGPGASGPAGVRWFNTGSTQLTFNSGSGGFGGNDTNSCAAGGGGGGGGWGGGGGGSNGNENAEANGGGGGGSFASASTCLDNDSPTTYQASPESSGNVFLVFNTEGVCQ